MQYVDIDILLQLHALVLLHDGGSDGVRDMGRLEAVVATQHQVVFDQELYVGVYQKAAAMIRGIIGDHPFSDGNKRTAMLVGLTFLEANGFGFIAEKRELEDFAVSVAVDHFEVGTIARWLEVHSERING